LQANCQTHTSLLARESFVKEQNVSDLYELGAFIGQGGKKPRQVFQHMLQLQQWGAFGCIAAAVEMKRL
jgi:hypothetical protein